MLRNPAHGRKLSLSHCCLGLTIGVLLLALTGCAERRAHAFPWATAVLVHPRLPTQVAPTLDGEPPPDLRPSIPETPLRLIAHSVPPRPREKAANAGQLGSCRAESGKHERAQAHTGAVGPCSQDSQLHRASERSGRQRRLGARAHAGGKGAGPLGRPRSLVVTALAPNAPGREKRRPLERAEATERATQHRTSGGQNLRGPSSRQVETRKRRSALRFSGFASPSGCGEKYPAPHPRCFSQRVRECLKTKALTFRGVQKSA